MSKTVIVRVWVLLLAGCLLLGGARARGQGASLYQLSADTVEIPFEYARHQILVRGSADSKTDLTFIFDTGASAPVLDVSLGWTDYPLVKTPIHEADGMTDGWSFRLNELRVGAEKQARVRQIPVLVMDLSQFQRALGRRIDGIIGIPFVAGYVTEIDYVRHVLRLHMPGRETKDKKPPDNRRTFLFDLKPTNPSRSDSNMTISGRIGNNMPYDFLLDTGFGGYLSVAHRAAQDSGLIGPDTPRISETNVGLNHAFASDKIRASALTLGTLDLSGRAIQVDVRNNDAAGQVGIIGNRLLQNYLVTLDYPHRKLRLLREVDQEEPDEADRPALGLALRADGSGLHVDSITRHSPASRFGLHPGDEIKAVNGKPLEILGLAQAVHILEAPEGATTLAILPAVDPNFGTRAAPLTCTLMPSSPLDWKAE